MFGDRIVYKVLRATTAASFVLTICGCVPAVVATGAKVGTTIVEERTAGDVIDDAMITATIKRLYAEEDFENLFTKTSVDTTEGRVMLTGSVKNHDLILKAVKMAWSVRGVKEVLNELEVADKNFKTRTHDRWISTQIATKMLIDRDIRSVNYTIDVNNGVVFLVGIAQTQAEMDAAIEIARKVRGVRKVVNHVSLKNDPRRIIN